MYIYMSSRHPLPPPFAANNEGSDEAVLKEVMFERKP